MGIYPPKLCYQSDSLDSWDSYNHSRHPNYNFSNKSYQYTDCKSNCHDTITMKRITIILQNKLRILFGGGALFLLLAFLPILADTKDFFLFLGTSSIFGGIILLIFHPRTVYRDTQEMSKGNVKIKQSTIEKNAVKMSFSMNQNLTTLLFVIVIGGFLINQLLLAKYNATATSNITKQPVSPIKTLNPIDEGIKVEMQQQGKEIPVLGTAHDHADLNVYINGEKLALGTPGNYMKSMFMHLDNNQNQSDANSVLHMHAKKVPLWLFFRSLGMNLTKDSLTLADGQVLKNENGKTLKFYLDGKKVDELGDYVFQPLDKLLISYGAENDPDLQNQMKSVTNFAKDHQK